MLYELCLDSESNKLTIKKMILKQLGKFENG